MIESGLPSCSTTKPSAEPPTLLKAVTASDAPETSLSSLARFGPQIPRNRRPQYRSEFHGRVQEAYRYHVARRLADNTSPCSIGRVPRHLLGYASGHLVTHMGHTWWPCRRLSPLFCITAFFSDIMGAWVWIGCLVARRLHRIGPPRSRSTIRSRYTVSDDRCMWLPYLIYWSEQDAASTRSWAYSGRYLLVM